MLKHVMITGIYLKTGFQYTFDHIGINMSYLYVVFSPKI